MGGMTLAFPLELLNDISSHFAKDELKVLRLVCKSFERAVSQLLFDHVVISNNFACLKTAKGIIGSFNSIIKTIVFCPVFYQDLTQEQYYQKKSKGVKKKIRNRVATRRHLEKAYATYCRLASEQREIFGNGECLAVLSVALRACTNARTLVFGAPSENENMWEWGMMRYGVNMDNLCPSSGSTIETRDHLDFYITPESC